MEQIKAGYKAFNGYVFTAATADLYSRTCEETERAIQLAGDNPSPMAQAAIDKARDNQNRMFKSIIESGEPKQYGLYCVTMKNGDTYRVNASGFKSAFNSLVNARIINAPKSAVKSCVLVKRIGV